MFLLLCASLKLIGQPEVYFNYATFNSPTKGPYIETYMSVVGKSLLFKKNTNNKFQGKMEVGILFLQNEQIKASKKYILNSSELDDTTNKPIILDQQRFLLEPGAYELEISRKDYNKPNSKVYVNKIPVKIYFPLDSVSISGIQFLESYKKSEQQGELTKNGLDMIPYVSDYFPDNMSTIKFYTELYNTQKALGVDEKFLVYYYIESYEAQRILPDYSSFSKQVANVVNPVLAEFKIDKLPSGNYNLVVEVKNKNNEIILAKKQFFQRHNPNVVPKIEDIAASTLITKGSYFENLNSKDTLIAYIKSLKPIATGAEKSIAEKKLDGYDISILKQYFFNFWDTRNHTEPEKEWFAYHKQVLKVNHEFGTQTRRGYDTDRGRVYLQYGEPNQRSVVNSESDTYPYEIWQYYRINGQTNKKFVFYNPDLASNNYQLIHSDTRGEVRNENWQVLLKKRNNMPFNLDTQNGSNNYGGNSDVLFKNPR